MDKIHSKLLHSIEPRKLQILNFINQVESSKPDTVFRDSFGNRNFQVCLGNLKIS